MHGGIYVGNVGHAKDVAMLQRLNIGAVINCAPSVCKDPVKAFRKAKIEYLEVDAKDDRSYPLLANHLPTVSAFISKVHHGATGTGTNVLVHCMAGVNRSATLAIAHLMIRDGRKLLELFAECSAARPSILQNPSFQLQLCELAVEKGLL